MNGLKTAVSVLVLAMSLAVTSTAEGDDTYIPPEYVNYCGEIGARYNVSPEFLESFIEAESSGNPNARNGHCKGLCQIYEDAHRDRMKRLGVSDVYDPRSNILVAADILVELFEQSDDAAWVCMAFNGSSDAKRRAEDFNFTDYADKVLDRARELEILHGKVEQ